MAVTIFYDEGDIIPKRKLLWSGDLDEYLKNELYLNSQLISELPTLKSSFGNYYPAMQVCIDGQDYVIKDVLEIEEEDHE